MIFVRHHHILYQNFISHGRSLSLPPLSMYIYNIYVCVCNYTPWYVIDRLTDHIEPCWPLTQPCQTIWNTVCDMNVDWLVRGACCCLQHCVLCLGCGNLLSWFTLLSYVYMGHDLLHNRHNRNTRLHQEAVHGVAHACSRHTATLSYTLGHYSIAAGIADVWL